MDVDKLILNRSARRTKPSFGTMMDVDKLILRGYIPAQMDRFGTMMDVDKLIRGYARVDC